MPAEDLGGRATCYACFRPLEVCLCGGLTSVDNRTLVSIVQHPRERQHPFNTARLAALGLRRSELLVDHVGVLRRSPERLGPLDGAMLLYPHPLARDVTTLAPSERPRRLIVIDGTWHHARTLYRDIPGLAALPHLTLPGHLRSGFQIRRQPDVHCLSTLEAIVFALRALEPETPGLERLLLAFERMQHLQLAVPRTSGRHRAERRARASRALPRPLVEGYADLVVAYAETSGAAADGSRQLICCAAERPATGERFFRVIAGAAPSPAHLAHLGLDGDALARAVNVGEFRAEWSRFLGAGGVLAAWNHATLELLCRAAGRPRAGVALKGTYYNLRRYSGSLEQIVSLEGLPPHSGELRASPVRALARLANALELAAFLHRSARVRDAAG